MQTIDTSSTDPSRASYHPGGAAGTAGTTGTAGTAGAANDAALGRAWSHVRVADVAVRPAADGAPLAVVRAAVFLGPLCPVDVVVELCLENVTADAPPLDLPRRRMWSDYPRGDGSFVFEARVPEEELEDAQQLRVRVRTTQPWLRARAAAAPAERVLLLRRALG